MSTYFSFFCCCGSTISITFMYLVNVIILCRVLVILVDKVSNCTEEDTDTQLIDIAAYLIWSSAL